MKKFYAGIGSRETPVSICTEMTKIATFLEREASYTLRSGNAIGADQAFSQGVHCNAQIWLPWSSFEREFQNVKLLHKYILVSDFDVDANESVSKFHPAHRNLPKSVHRLMARNFRQIVGLGEPNSDFVICWTKDGEAKGGTGQAIRIAKSLNIPVINMFNYDTCEKVLDFIDIHITDIKNAN